MKSIIYEDLLYIGNKSIQNSKKTIFYDFLEELPIKLIEFRKKFPVKVLILTTLYKNFEFLHKSLISNGLLPVEAFSVIDFYKQITENFFILDFGFKEIRFFGKDHFKSIPSFLDEIDIESENLIEDFKNGLLQVAEIFPETEIDKPLFVIGNIFLKEDLKQVFIEKLNLTDKDITFKKEVDLIEEFISLVL